MNILFIGRFYPKGIFENIISDTNNRVMFSNHNFEISLISGLKKQSNIKLRILTAPMVYSYPHNNKRYRYKEINYTEGATHFRSVGFCNIAILNMFSTVCSLTKAINQELNLFNEEKVSIIVNTPSIILSTALFKAIKHSYKKVQTTLIVPDIPECMVEMDGKSTIKYKLLQFLNKRTAQLSKKYDKYVFLTDKMNEFYQAKSEDYIVMEGLIDNNKYIQKFSEHIINPRINGEIILYTGTLRRIFGIMNLIEVFEQGNFSNAELWICGSGECSAEIKERAKNNPKIKFMGLVDSSKAAELQKKATILANPRMAEGNYTKYSFPSKTIEYLLAGKSVIMNRLPGIPREYDKYLNYPKDESISEWIKEIHNIMKMDFEEREKRNLAAQNFILTNKVASIQCARIIELSK